MGIHPVVAETFSLDCGSGRLTNRPTLLSLDPCRQLKTDLTLTNTRISFWLQERKNSEQSQTAVWLDVTLRHRFVIQADNFSVCVCVRVCLWPFEEVFQSTPVLLHLSQTLLSGSAVTLQLPPTLLQLTTLMSLLLQLVLQLRTNTVTGRTRGKIQRSHRHTAVKGITEGGFSCVFEHWTFY